MNNLRAALVLTLNDQLTAGLNRFKSQFESLRNLGRTLGLGKLENGSSILDKNAQAARGLTSSLRGVAGAADRAWAAMKRAGSATAGWGKKTFGPMSRTEAFTAAAEGFSVIEPIRSYAGFENIARQSAVTQGLGGAAANAESQRLMKFFDEDALKYAQSSTSVARAYQGMIQTGMITPQEAMKLLPIHSEVATAYALDPDVLGNAVASLHGNLGIGPEEMEGTLAAMALAGKSGRFKAEDFSGAMPGITGNMATFGWKGRGAANSAFAALEQIMKVVRDPGSGAADFNQFLNDIAGPHAARTFALEGKGISPVQKRFLEQYHITGIDMPKLLENARVAGVNPMEAVLGALQKKVSGLPPEAVKEILGAFLGNEQSRDVAQALLLHAGDYLDLKKKLEAADPSMLHRDAATMMAGPQKQLDLMVEQLTQLGRMVGAAFLPILTAMVSGLRAFSGALDVLDRKLPGVKNDTLLAVGGFFALSAIVAVLRVALPVITGAWSILAGVLRLALMPLRLIWTGLAFVVEALGALLGVSTTVVVAIVAALALLAAAAYDIIAHWSTFAGFYESMWEGVKDIFIGVAEFIGGFFLTDMDMSIDGIKRIWTGLTEFFSGLFGGAKQLFLDFINTLDSWTGGAIIGTFNAIRDAIGGVIDKIHEWIEALKNSGLGQALGFGDTKTGAAGDKPGDALTTNFGNLPAPANGNVNVIIGVDPVSGMPMILHAASDSPSVRVSGGSVNPGQTLGRP